MSVSSVVGLQIAKATRLKMSAVDAIEIETAAGIVGDRYHGSRHRQVSVQSASELAEASEKFGSVIDPLLTRRNITVDVGPVPTTPGHRWSIGAVELEVVRIAAPCKLLEDELGRGAKDALRRRAGVICRVLSGGPVKIGDLVEL